MEEFFEAMTGGALWGIGFGVAASLVGGLGRGLRPAVKSVVKGGLTVSDWVRETTAESRETLQDIYAEAKSERAARDEAAARGEPTTTRTESTATAAGD